MLRRSRRSLYGGAIIAKINDLEKNFLKFSPEDFIRKTAELKNNIAQGRNLDEILPESFALVREAAKRTRNETAKTVTMCLGDLC